jgi:predicted 3-demethylubiquinone-9 3-methyltransferase (glyoxalase superfamily)
LTEIHHEKQPRKRRTDMQKVTPFLWFDDKAEEAAEFYVEVFNNRPGGSKESKVQGISRYGEEGPGTPGKAMTASFILEGLEFTALNGGPEFAFTEATSFHVSCESQDEVDHFWKALTDGGEESQCGWLKDRYGLSWQIIPTALHKLLGDPDPGRSGRAMKAMLQMNKIDIAELERAADEAA